MSESDDPYKKRDGYIKRSGTSICGFKSIRISAQLQEVVWKSIMQSWDAASKIGHDSNTTAVKGKISQPYRQGSTTVTTTGRPLSCEAMSTTTDAKVSADSKVHMTPRTLFFRANAHLSTFQKSKRSVSEGNYGRQNVKKQKHGMWRQCCRKEQ